VSLIDIKAVSVPVIAFLVWAAIRRVKDIATGAADRSAS
jgi:hypothetical protein